jgi:hypothetical protein
LIFLINLKPEKEAIAGWCATLALTARAIAADAAGTTLQAGPVDTK